MNIRIDASSYLEHRQISGVGHYSRQLAEALSASHNVEYTTGPFYVSSTPKIPSKAATFANKIYRKGVSYRLGTFFDSFMKPADLTIFPNFFHWPSTHSSLTAVVIHDLTYLHFPESVEAKNLKFLHRIVPRSIDRSSFVITVSEAMKREIVDTFSVNEDKVVVTPIPADPTYFTETSDDLLNKHPDLQMPYVLFIGNLEPRKNVSLLLDAYVSLPNELKEQYSLVVAGGNGWNSESVQMKINNLMKSGERIHRLGYIDQKDMPSLYKNASLTVLPSLYEGFGMTILESLAVSTPVLASDIDVFREVGGDSLAYFDNGSKEDLSDKLKSMLSAPREIDIAAFQNTISWKANVTAIENMVKRIKGSQEISG